MTRHVLFIVAPEKTSAGARDYALGITDALLQARDEVQDDVAYHICRLPNPGDALLEMAADVTFDARDSLPQSRMSYSQLPVFHPDMVDAIDREVEIVGLGRTALEPMLEMQAELERRGIAASTSYVTHLVDKADKAKIIDRKVKVISPVFMHEMVRDGFTDPVEICAVPHTNTPSLCAVEWAKFAKTDNGQIVQDWREEGREYAAVVLNAGFKTDKNGEKLHTPYTAEEAYEAALALGSAMPAGAPLLLAHGGPRNGQDEEAGEMTTKAFMLGYQDAQRRKGVENPEVIVERFDPNAPPETHDTVKAILHMGRDPHCRAVVLSCEGYGTMEGGIRNLWNDDYFDDQFGTKRVVGMFVSNISLAVPERVDNTMKYHMLGYSTLRKDDALAEAGGSLLAVKPSIGQLPQRDRDPNKQVIKALQLLRAA